MSDGPRRILFVTFDVIGPLLGGSAIRVLGLARAMARVGFSVTLAAPRIGEVGSDEPFAIRSFDITHARKPFRLLLENSDAVILPLHALVRLPFLRKAKIPLVFDIYDPVLFELMEANADADELRTHAEVVSGVLRRGDFFLCASERQRNHWLGELVTNGRGDVSESIEVVPFGIDPAPSPPRALTRKIFSHIPRSEKIIVWPGGIWDWTDPVTTLQALEILARRGLAIHLVFFAGQHPNENNFGSAAAKKAREFADELKITNRTVHFIDDYIPYSERGNYLAECDAAVSTHRANLESHFAYRARLLDCIWAGLPIVCSTGDVLAEMVARDSLGLVVPTEDAQALADALERIAHDALFAEACRESVIASRRLFDWNDAVKPLARFCAQPRVTHRTAPMADARTLINSAASVWKKHGARETWRRLQQHLRNR